MLQWNIEASEITTSQVARIVANWQLGSSYRKRKVLVVVVQDSRTEMIQLVIMILTLPQHELQRFVTLLNSLSSEKQMCSRMKLMLVGQENVGKTSLGKCLLKSTTAERKILKRFLPIGGSGGTSSSPAQPVLGATQVTNANLSTDGIDILFLLFSFYFCCYALVLFDCSVTYDNVGASR